MLTKCKNTSLHESSVFGVFLVRMWENIDQKNSEYRHFYVFSFKTVRKINGHFSKKAAKVIITVAFLAGQHLLVQSQQWKYQNNV